VLFLVAFGSIEGYDGNVVIAEGQGFSNSLTSYDAFKPGRIFNAASLPPFVVWLDKFSASYIEQGSQRGQPNNFDARIRYKSGLSSPTRNYDLRVNKPLAVDGARVYLLGHGYAPEFTVKDGKGNVVFSGPVVFLPSNQTTYQSEGVIKVPDAQPSQLGFLGVFMPSAVPAGKQVASIFPAADNPLVTLVAYQGNLGENNGIPQSVYQLNTSAMTKVDATNQPLHVGQSVRLPNGLGSITYTGYKQWISLQITHDPGGSWALFACALAIIAIVTSFAVRRRRVWVRATPGIDGRTVVEVGGLTLGGETAEFEDIVGDLKTTIGTEE
jgi:cytochrome c biogenesis protein